VGEIGASMIHILIGNPIAPLDSCTWKCDWLHCLAGMGLAGNGCCFLFGMWWHSACPCFEDEDETLAIWYGQALLDEQTYGGE